MISKLVKVRDALTAVEGLKVYHYFRPQLELPYCIWAEDGEASQLEADNYKVGQTIEGTIDYFTKTEFDENNEAIQKALNNVEGLAWYLNSVQFEDDTNTIHYEWVFRVL